MTKTYAIIYNKLRIVCPKDSNMKVLYVSKGNLYYNEGIYENVVIFFDRNKSDIKMGHVEISKEIYKYINSNTYPLSSLKKLYKIEKLKKGYKISER